MMTVIRCRINQATKEVIHRRKFSKLKKKTELLKYSFPLSKGNDQDLPDPNNRVLFKKKSVL